MEDIDVKVLGKASNDSLLILAELLATKFQEEKEKAPNGDQTIKSA